VPNTDTESETLFPETANLSLRYCIPPLNNCPLQPKIPLARTFHSCRNIHLGKFNYSLFYYEHYYFAIFELLTPSFTQGTAISLLCLFLFILFVDHLVTPSVNLDILRPIGGTRKRSWLRHYATSRKVAGSSPDEVDFFNLPNPSRRTIALGSTQPLTKMSTRNLSGSKGRPARKANKLTAICEPTV
jgi:hypothetical protein